MCISTRASLCAILPDQQECHEPTEREMAMQGTCVHVPTGKGDLVELKASEMWDRMVKGDKISEDISRGRFIEYALNTHHTLNQCTSSTIACICSDVRKAVSKNGFVLLTTNATICKSKSCHQLKRCSCGNIKRSHHCRKKDGSPAGRCRKSC